MLSALSQFIFGSSGLFGAGGRQSAGASSSGGWRDKTVCFDLRQSDLELCAGEQLIACLFPIEDVKGNPDQLGLLKVTNLRLMWICFERKRVNLSIGWRTVSLTFEQNLMDSLGLPQSSLVVLTKSDSIKYEFVFKRNPSGNYPELTGLDNQDDWGALMQLAQLSRQDDAPTAPVSHLTPMQLIDYNELVFKVWTCYKRTQLFRVCRYNLTSLKPTAVTSRNEEQSDDDDVSSQPPPPRSLGSYNKLPSEQTIETFERVFYVESKNIKNIGTLILTNIRLLWIDEALPLKNLSIPWIRIEFVKLKQLDRIQVGVLDYLVSSHQVELVAAKTSSGHAGGPARPTSKLIFEQVQNLRSAYKSRPHFGPESCDQCLAYMSLLRPVENFEDMIASELGLFGAPPAPREPANNIIKLINEPPSAAEVLASLRGDGFVRPNLSSFPGFFAISGQPISATDEHLEAEKNRIIAIMEQSERDLKRYNSNSASYLNERPIERDAEVIYAEEFGLAVERPANDTSLGKIWRIDL